MKIAIISFTSKGKEISKKLKEELKEQVTEIDKNTFTDKVSSHMKDIFNGYDALVFISSTGIAVRLISPYVKDKTTDPAVIVIDDLGKYTISLLSGHIGGANELSKRISSIIENQNIITTASDGRGIDAVDLFAKRHNLYIENMEHAKDLTALMIEEEPIKLISEVDIKINYENVDMININDYTKKNINFKKENLTDNTKGIIAVTSIKDITNLLIETDKKKPICILRPRNLNIGIGCRRGKSRDEIRKAIDLVFKEHNLSIRSIKKVGTIDIKHDEQGIIDVSKELDADMVIFSKEELESVSDAFKGSDFVESQVGVRSVCEPSALLLGREILVKKQVLNGVTIAVSRSENNG